jgi:PEP-CTERM motif
MTNFTKLSCVLFLALLIFSADIKADPIQIVSGVVNNSSLNLQSGISFSFSGTTGSPVSTIFGTNYAQGSSALPIIDVFQLNGSGNSASTISYTGNYSGSNLTTGFGGSFGTSSLIFTSLQAFTMPLPVQPQTGGFPLFSVQVPFSMQGYLVGRTGCSSTGPCDPIPRIDLAGNGSATYNFSYFLDSWHLNSYQYNFENTNPTPEPATLILMGTGLAGIIGYAKKRRKKQSE